ncbi:Claudin domain containing 2 [Mactra antiquata]
MIKAFAKLTLLLTLISCVFMIIGTATKYWSLEHGKHVGLWQKANHELRPWLQAVRVLEIIGIFGAVFNFILLIIYIKKEDGQTNLLRIRLVALFSVISAFFCIAGVILYVGKKNAELNCPDCTFGWSLVLTCSGGAILALMLLPIAVEIKRSRVLGSYESI